jgi:hypothetical protein
MMQVKNNEQAEVTWVRAFHFGGNSGAVTLAQGRLYNGSQSVTEGGQALKGENGI